MRSITLHTCRSICINQHVKHDIKGGSPCTDCCIQGICMLFVDIPVNWNEKKVKVIDENSSAFYKLKKEANNA